MNMIVRRILMAVAAIFMAFFAFQVGEYFHYKSDQDRSAVQQGEETAAALKAEIEGLLTKVEAEGTKLGELFGSRDLSVEEVKDLIRETSLEFPEIRGVTACYEPDAFSSERRLFCPYYNKGSASYVFVGQSYDYSVKADNTEWYTSVIETGKTWIDPYYGTAAQEWYVDFGVPFYFSSGPRAGQVRGMIDFSLEVGDFKNLVHSISVGKTGYGFVTSGNGKFLTHPIADYVGTKGLDDLIAEEDQPALLKAYQGLKANETGHVQFFDEMNNEPSLFFYDQIETNGFGIGLSFFKGDLMGKASAMNRRYITMALTASAILVLLIALYFGRDVLDRSEIELLSILGTLLLFANVLLIGFLTHTAADTAASNESPPITDVASLGNFVNQEHARSDRLKTPKARPVPTGIYIDRMEFEDSYNLNIGGTVWQKYPLDIVEDVSVGFRFPQMSPFAEASYIEESSRERVEPKEGEAGYLHVSWDVRVTLRLNLKYGNFPFDKRHLDIEIVPLSQADHLIFVPDLSSYSYTNPSRLSGLSKNIDLPGNALTKSFYNFSSETVETDFGSGSKDLFQNMPVLHYNIYMKRKLLNAFVTYLIPIFVAMCLIYILILACEKTEARQGIIESMAAFFFVLIFSHIDLRKDIVTADLIFIEYFYFITYLMIVLSTANLIIYTKPRPSVFDFNDNQIFRAVYFPLFFALLLIVMLDRFY